ncbi:MAG: carboxypeptidase-like regulatory domain-containing protein [Flavobacteriaceae bacterium]|nr:carboxypeptidase-like regulatory domain-containing protein [Flavobacteriaceae bacterium]
MRKNVIYFLLFVPMLLFAQTKTVTGTVTAKSDGAPLPGVNVLVKGTTAGTQTDFDGNYSLKVQEGAVLQFSYVGFKTKEVKVSGG